MTRAHFDVSVVCSNVKCSLDISISNLFLEKKKKNLKHFWGSPCDLFQPAVLFKPFYFVVAQLGFDPKRTVFLKVQIPCSGGKGGFPKGSRRDDKGEKMEGPCLWNKGNI